MRDALYRAILTLAASIIAIVVIAGIASAEPKSGDVINRENSQEAVNLLSPGNYLLVRQGMVMKITPTTHLDWPPPYKSATERYSQQVSLAPDGGIRNYKAGLPFPLVDVNDPDAASKIIWNFEFRPLYTDDLDARDVQAISRGPASSTPIEVMTAGHLGLYRSIGRTEVEPTPVDADMYQTGIVSRSGMFPILEPAELHGAGILRERSIQPGIEDTAYEYSSETGRLRRLPATQLSDVFGVPENGSASTTMGTLSVSAYASTVDPDSTFGFAAKPADYNYKFLGERAMLASVDAANSPARACAEDGGRTVCPEDWQMRNLYVIEATAKRHSLIGDKVSIPRRVLYIDSEGWFVTASDLFDRSGQLWKTIVAFQAYRDRPVPAARVAIWPFKRMFQTALVDEDVTTGFSTTTFTPSHDSDSDGWYINSGLVDKAFFTPANLQQNH